MLTYENANRLKDDFSYLIGEDYNGHPIDDLIITPANDPEFRVAIRGYTINGFQETFCFASEENGYTVTAIVFRDALRKAGNLFHIDIFHIFDSKGITIDNTEYGIE